MNDAGIARRSTLSPLPEERRDEEEVLSGL